MTTTVIDAPPHAMFRILIRWGRFVFEPHSAPTTSSSFANQQNHFLFTTSSKQQQQLQDGSQPTQQQQQQHQQKTGKENMLSAVEQANGTEYRLVWFRAIDGVAIGHTKWCGLTLLHSVVSVIDFQSAPAVIDIASGYMANAATRVILLQLQQRSIDPTLGALINSKHNHVTSANNASPAVVAATGAVDMGMFVGSPPRSYIVTLEASFFSVGKLHMNLVVKEPRLDDGLIGSDGGLLPLGQQSSSSVLLAQKQAIRRRNQRRNLERLTVLVVDSIEAERADGGKVHNVGVYGIARLLQESATDEKRFPLPSDSVYQIKVSFVTDPKYVAKPMLARNSGAYSSVDGNAGDGIVLANNNNNNNKNDRGNGGYDNDVDEDGDDNDGNSRNKRRTVGDPDRRVVTFRTLLQKPHDGRVLWRCGIALNPCTKVKFALYRDQSRIGSTAIMASQLAVAAMPHDFSLPIKVRHATGNSVHVHQLQINLTISEHTLDTVSGEAISNYLNTDGGAADVAERNQMMMMMSSTATAGHVCMVPGSDLMVLLRGYEVAQEDKNVDLYLKNHPEANRFHDDDDDDDDRDEEKDEQDFRKQKFGNTKSVGNEKFGDELKKYDQLLRGSSTSPRFSISPSPDAKNNKKQAGGTSPFNTTETVAMIQNKNKIRNVFSAGSPTNYHIREFASPQDQKNGNTNNNQERFSQIAPVVLPDELKELIDPKSTGGFVGRNVSPLTIKISPTANVNAKKNQPLPQQQQQQQRASPLLPSPRSKLLSSPSPSSSPSNDGQKKLLFSQHQMRPLQTENERLEAENAALREAIQEQEDRIRDQESYILTLLENQGVVTIVEDDEDGEGGAYEFDDENYNDNDDDGMEDDDDHNNNNIEQRRHAEALKDMNVNKK